MTQADFEAAGLYDPASPTADERLQLLEWLVSRGVGLESMQQAHARGFLLFVASSGQMRERPSLTQQDLMTELGESAETLDEFRTSLALPPALPGAPWCTTAEVELFRGVQHGVGLFGLAEMKRLSRVIGSAVSRIAEAAASTERERMRKSLSSGATELEIAKGSLAVTHAIATPAMLASGLLRVHMELSLQRARGRGRTLVEETVTGCVGFVDLVGSTSLSRRLSPEQLGKVVDHFEDVAHEVAIRRDGRVVKFIGDEVMFVTSGPEAACDIALTMVETFEGNPDVTPRAGLAWGPMLDRGGDYYGPIVNLAARLAELAVPREVLASTDVVEALASTALAYESAGRRQLRGFDEPVSLVSIRRG